MITTLMIWVGLAWMVSAAVNPILVRLAFGTRISAEDHAMVLALAPFIMCASVLTALIKAGVHILWGVLWIATATEHYLRKWARERRQ